MGGKEYEYPLPSTPELDEFIMWVDKNQEDLGWKPNKCMLSQSHPEHKCEPEKPVQSLAQVSSQQMEAAL